MFVAVKLKQFKTIDVRTLFPVLMQYYEKTDDLAFIMNISREKDSMRKRKDKNKEDCVSDE